MSESMRRRPSPTVRRFKAGDELAATLVEVIGNCASDPDPRVVRVRIPSTGEEMTVSLDRLESATPAAPSGGGA